MCFSAQVWADYRKFVRQFGADVDIQAFVQLFRHRLSHSEIRIPKAMAQAFAEPLADEGKQIQELQARFLATEAARLEKTLFEQKTRLNQAEKKLEVKVTKTAQNDVRVATNKIEKARNDLTALRQTEAVSSDARIFPGGYAPVLIVVNGRRTIKPMRYRCRLPGWTSTIERQYDGSYNARRDNLESKWPKLFGYKHGVAVFNRFYENVDRNGANQVLEFEPQDHRPMLVACLWSDWQGDSPYPLLSFAAITDEPPAEVAAAGHDRCPIPLKEKYLDPWLNPDASGLDALQEILEDRERPYYEHRLAEAA